MKHVFYFEPADPMGSFFLLRATGYTPNPAEYRFVVSTDAADVFRVMNVVDGSDIELPRKLRCRSMCVGDIVLEDGKAELCAPCGWTELGADVAAALAAMVPS